MPPNTQFHPRALAFQEANLTEQERIFCELIAEGADQTTAGEKSGLIAYGGRRAVLDALAKPSVQNRVHSLLRHSLSTVGASIGATQIAHLAQHAESESVRLGAAKWLAEDNGFGVASRIADRAENQAPRTLAEYSLAELENLVKSGAETLNNLKTLKVIDATPTGSDSPPSNQDDGDKALGK